MLHFFSIAVFRERAEKRVWGAVESTVRVTRNLVAFARRTRNAFACVTRNAFACVTRNALALALAVPFLFAACDGSAGPAAGTMTATIVSPNGAEGAAHITLFGPGVQSVGQIDARTFSNQSGDTMQVVVVRDQPGELRFSIQVADTTRPPVAILREVAGADNALRQGFAGYSVEIRP